MNICFLIYSLKAVEQFSLSLPADFPFSMNNAIDLHLKNLIISHLRIRVNTQHLHYTLFFSFSYLKFNSDCASKSRRICKAGFFLLNTRAEELVDLIIEGNKALFRKKIENEWCFILFDRRIYALQVVGLCEAYKIIFHGEQCMIDERRIRKRIEDWIA